jgi:hypothetical protein
MESKAAMESAAKSSEKNNTGEPNGPVNGADAQVRPVQGQPAQSRQAANAYNPQQGQNAIGSLFQAVA